MTDYTELYIDQGTDFEFTIVLEDDETNVLQSVDSYIITSSMRRSPLSPSPSGNLICSITDAANGEITIKIDSANTANLHPGTHLFDIKAYATGITSRLIEGIIIVTPSITK